MMRIISAVLALVVLAGIAVLIAGYITPPAKSGSTSFVVNYDPNGVWEELLNVEGSIYKKRDVVSVEIIERRGNLFAWKENLVNGGYRIYRTNEVLERRKLVVELTESTYGLTGTWTFEIDGDSNGTNVHITEKSTLTDLNRRGIRFFFGKEHDLLVWTKYITVGMTQRLIRTS